MVTTGQEMIKLFMILENEKEKLNKKLTDTNQALNVEKQSHEQTLISMNRQFERRLSLLKYFYTEEVS
jgi:hypothetical protein